VHDHTYSRIVGGRLQRSGDDDLSLAAELRLYGRGELFSKKPGLCSVESIGSGRSWSSKSATPSGPRAAYSGHVVHLGEREDKPALDVRRDRPSTVHSHPATFYPAFRQCMSILIARPFNRPLELAPTDI
jgi:hypothetical protein